MLLASCGGGTEQVDAVQPTRFIAFGDEMSVLDQRGAARPQVHDQRAQQDEHRRSTAQPTRSGCGRRASPTRSAFVFPECNPSARRDGAVSYRRARRQGRRTCLTADRRGSVASERPFGSNDLVTV